MGASIPVSRLVSYPRCLLPGLLLVPPHVRAVRLRLSNEHVSYSSSLPPSDGDGRESTQSSLPAFSLSLRLLPWGSSGEYFSGADETIISPHSLHLGPRPYKSHALQYCNFDLTIALKRLAATNGQ